MNNSEQIIDLAFIKSYDRDLFCSYAKLNPTGRWKIVIKQLENCDPETSLYIEHKGWFLKQWISEGDIVFERRIETVFDCKN